MNVYTLSDGNHTEGIGALLQYQLFCYGYCKLNSCNFNFEGFKNLQHFQYTDQTQKQFSECLTNFCGLPITGISSDSHFLSPQYLMGYGQSNINKIIPFIQELQINPISLSYFDSSNFNVAVHIRNYTQTDCDPSPVRECFNHSDRGKTLNYYSRLYEKIKLLQNKKIVYHIYSQGKYDDFEIFNNIFENVQFHLDEHPIITLYHMISCNLLIMANSSLSYVSHLYGRNKCIAKPSFYHTLYQPNILQ